MMDMVTIHVKPLPSIIIVVATRVSRFLNCMYACTKYVVQAGDDQSKPSKQCGLELHSSSVTFAVHDEGKAIKNLNSGLRVDGQRENERVGWEKESIPRTEGSRTGRFVSVTNESVVVIKLVIDLDMRQTQAIPSTEYTRGRQKREKVYLPAGMQFYNESIN